MNGSMRRDQIVQQIQDSQEPVPGKRLAELFGVSRQVIVQDIALIRAAGYDIISTNRGYMIQSADVVSRVFKMHHTDEQTEEELYSIVDLGGSVENVMVNHRVYGHMEVALGIYSRRKVSIYINDIKSGKSTPLKNITSNYHYHTISAESEEVLDEIEEMLREKGFLVES